MCHGVFPVYPLSPLRVSSMDLCTGFPRYSLQPLSIKVAAQCIQAVKPSSLSHQHLSRPSCDLCPWARCVELLVH